MGKNKRIELDDFAGGMVSAGSKYRLARNQTPLCKNMYWLDEVGALIGMYGTQAFNDTGLETADFQGFDRLYPTGNTAVFLAAINGKLYRGSDSSDIAVVQEAGSDLAASTGDMYFAFHDDTAYFCYGNSTDDMCSVTRTGDFTSQVATDSSSPYLITWWNDRMWIVETGDVLKGSEIRKPTTFGTTAGFERAIGEKDNQIITAIVGYRQYLLIFKKSRIYVLTGNNPYEYNVQILSSSVGCVAPRSIVEYGDVLYFWDDKGMHTLRGLTLDYRMNGRTRPLTWPVKNIVNSISDTYRPSIASGIFRNFLKIAYKDPDIAGAYNNNQIVIDLETEQVCGTAPGVHAAMYVTQNGTGDAGELYHASSDGNGKIYRQEIGYNHRALEDGTGGTAIASSWLSRPLPPRPGMTGHDCIKVWLEGFTGGTDMTVKVYIDLNSPAVFTGTLTFTKVAGTGKKLVELGETSSDDLAFDTDTLAEVLWGIGGVFTNTTNSTCSFQVEFSHEVAGSRPELRRAVFEYSETEQDIA